MEVYTRKLPNYTSERYFLLSEIEQRSKFYYILDDDGIPCKADSVIENSNLKLDEIIIYLLWNMTENLNQLNTNIEAIDGYLTSFINKEHLVLQQKSLIVIEIYHAKVNENNFDMKEYNEILSMLSKYFDKFGTICLGVSNNTKGTCGLECIYDYCNGITGNSIDLYHVPIIALNSTTFLGIEGDIRQEPDAVSGVFQCILSNNKDSIEDWTKNFQLGKSDTEANYTWMMKYSINNNNIIESPKLYYLVVIVAIIYAVTSYMVKT